MRRGGIRIGPLRDRQRHARCISGAAVAPETYVVSVEARGFEPAVQGGLTAQAAGILRLTIRLVPVLASIGSVGSRIDAIAASAAAERFTVATDQTAGTENAAGLAAYTTGTAQAAAAAVPGIGLDTFGNAIVRGGKVEDTVFDVDSVPVPQGLIAEPGGNVVGAQLASTGMATTVTTLAGFSNEGDNALGGIVGLIPLIGTYPARVMLELSDGAGAQLQHVALQAQWATPDLRLRYAFAARNRL